RFKIRILHKTNKKLFLIQKCGLNENACFKTVIFKSYFQSNMPDIITYYHSNVDGQQVTVIDTPGLFDTRFGEDKTTKDLSQCICYAAPGPHIFLVVVAIGRFTEEEKQSVQKIQEIFGEAANRYSMVLFTRGDDLEDTTIEDYLSKSPELQDLVSRCNNQYHVFNNKLKDKKSQVTELLEKIRTIVDRNGGSHYTNDMFRKAKEELQRKIEEQYEKKMQEMQKELKGQLE
uniref:AIG1-type G domain-containing protein n=1 Tax=Poecilia formosa TaxID=48698 RepID=A0A096M3B9_POEFO